jgi:hypothetical protein
MARAFRHIPPPVTKSASFSPTKTRPFSAFSIQHKWEGRKAEENTVRETDTNNIQQDASREGKEERAEGEGSRETSEQAGDSNKKAKEEVPEAPDTIGMQDERGGVSLDC